MKKYCENPLCKNRSVKEVPVSVKTAADQTRALCAACEEVYTWGVQHSGMDNKGLKIDPPPKEDGDEPLFRVVYIIDVNSPDAHEAAEYAHRIMTDPESMRPVLHVLDSSGVQTVIDLSEDNAKNFNYEDAAQYLADQGDQIFTGPMNGGLWNGRCLDACVMSKKQGDKTAYDFLLKYGDLYASNLPADKQQQWQIIKGQATNILLGQQR